MLLRRVIEHFQEQNWTAVFIDFLIVVIGVFIGIQVANWNDTRAERKLEKEYLVRLYSDMENGISAIRKDTEWDEYRLSSQALVLKALRQKKLAPEDELDFTRGLMFVGIHNPIRRQWGTVEELKSTGNIALIQDTKLREMIASADESFERRNRIASQSELRLSHYREQIFTFIEPVEFGLSTYDDAKANYDFDALAANPDFVKLIASANFEATMFVEFAQGYIGELEAIKQRLAKGLGEKTPEDD